MVFLVIATHFPREAEKAPVSYHGDKYYATVTAGNWTRDLLRAKRILMLKATSVEYHNLCAMGAKNCIQTFWKLNKYLAPHILVCVIFITYTFLSLRIFLLRSKEFRLRNLSQCNMIGNNFLRCAGVLYKRSVSRRR